MKDDEMKSLAKENSFFFLQVTCSNKCRNNPTKSISVDVMLKDINCFPGRVVR